MRHVADDSQDLRQIEARWKSIEWIEAWAKLPRATRERVLADLEENARQTSGAEADAYLLAADALEGAVRVVGMFGTHFATEDVRALIGIAKRGR